MVLGIAGVAILSRLGFCWVTGVLGETPATYREYVYGGSRLLHHGVITSPMVLEDVSLEPSSMLPPAYLAVVAAVYYCFGVDTVGATVALHVLNSVASAAAVLMIFFAAERLYGRKAALFASGLALAHPAFVAYTGLIWDTSLFLCGVCLIVYLILRWSDRSDDWRRQLAIGLSLGLLAYVNPALTLAYPLLVLWFLTRRSGWHYGRLCRGISLIVVGWAVAIAPWTIRNYRHFGEWQYIRGTFDLVLWLGACPEAHSDPSAVYPTWYPMRNASEQHKLIMVGEHEYVRELGQMARQAIRADFAGWLGLCGWRALDYWSGTVFSHASHDDGGWPKQLPRKILTVFLGLETALLIAGILFLRPLGSDIKWMTGIIVVSSVIYVLTHVQVRYRAPFEPFMVLILVGFLARISGRFGKAAHAGPTGKAGGSSIQQ